MGLRWSLYLLCAIYELVTVPGVETLYKYSVPHIVFIESSKTTKLQAETVHVDEVIKFGNVTHSCSYDVDRASDIADRSPPMSKIKWKLAALASRSRQYELRIPKSTGGTQKYILQLFFGSHAVVLSQNGKGEHVPVWEVDYLPGSERYDEASRKIHEEYSDIGDVEIDVQYTCSESLLPRFSGKYPCVMGDIVHHESRECTVLNTHPVTGKVALMCGVDIVKVAASTVSECSKNVPSASGSLNSLGAYFGEYPATELASIKSVTITDGADSSGMLKEGVGRMDVLVETPLACTASNSKLTMNELIDRALVGTCVSSSIHGRVVEYCHPGRLRMLQPNPTTDGKVFPQYVNIFSHRDATSRAAADIVSHSSSESHSGRHIGSSLELKYSTEDSTLVVEHAEALASNYFVHYSKPHGKESSHGSGSSTASRSNAPLRTFKAVGSTFNPVELSRTTGYQRPLIEDDGFTTLAKFPVHFIPDNEHMCHGPSATSHAVPEGGFTLVAKRGHCDFLSKTINAQAYGAAALLIVDMHPDNLIPGMMFSGSALDTVPDIQAFLIQEAEAWSLLATSTLSASEVSAGSLKAPYARVTPRTPATSGGFSLALQLSCPESLSRSLRSSGPDGRLYDDELSELDFDDDDLGEATFKFAHGTSDRGSSACKPGDQVSLKTVDNLDLPAVIDDVLGSGFFSILRLDSAAAEMLRSTLAKSAGMAMTVSANIRDVMHGSFLYKSHGIPCLPGTGKQGGYPSIHVPESLTVNHERHVVIPITTDLACVHPRLRPPILSTQSIVCRTDGSPKN